MEPNRDVPPPRDQGDRDSGRWSGLPRTTAFWSLAVFLPPAVFQLREGGRPSSTELSYTRFRHQVSERNVASVTIRDGRAASGQLCRSVAPDGTEFIRFRARLPAEADSEFLPGPERFSRPGGRLPEGVVIGPPGTGKTLMARAEESGGGEPSPALV